MAEFDTAELMDSILRDAKVPGGSSYRTASVLLGMADEQLRTLVVPELLKAPGDMLATRATIPLVAGRAPYRLPPRLLRLLEVWLVDGNGRQVVDFSRATPAQVRQFSAGVATSSGRPRWWHLESSGLHVWPAPDGASAYSLTIRYARRPSRLVEPNATWLVQSINPFFGQLSVTGAADLFAQGVVDVVKGTPGFECLAESLRPTINVNGADWAVTFSTPPMPEGLEVGDYLCVPGTAPFPQVPADYHAVLAQATVAQVLKEQGDTAGEAAARQRVAELLATAQPILEPRAEEAEVCVNDSWL